MRMQFHIRHFNKRFFGFGEKNLARFAETARDAGNSLPTITIFVVGVGNVFFAGWPRIATSNFHNVLRSRKAGGHYATRSGSFLIPPIRGVSTP